MTTTVSVFRSGDGRVFANVDQGGVQLAHLKVGESYVIPSALPAEERVFFNEKGAMIASVFRA